MKVNYYALVTVRNKLIVTDGKLPVYWSKSVAKKAAERFGAKMIVIKISEFYKLLKP